MNDLPHTAAEYAEMVQQWLNTTADTGSYIAVGTAQAYATLALAAATFEAARLMGPTPEDQRRLDELMPASAGDRLAAIEGEIEGLDNTARDLGRRVRDLESANYSSAYCPREWEDEEAEVPRQWGGYGKAVPGVHWQGSKHRCSHPPGHEKDEPHYCLCGSEL